jgi:hypothetical protein
MKVYIIELRRESVDIGELSRGLDMPVVFH